VERRGKRRSAHALTPSVTSGQTAGAKSRLRASFFSRYSRHAHSVAKDDIIPRCPLSILVGILNHQRTTSGKLVIRCPVTNVSVVDGRHTGHRALVFSAKEVVGVSGVIICCHCPGRVQRRHRLLPPSNLARMCRMIKIAFVAKAVQ